MTNITITQNEERQLQRLAAQRQLYTCIKAIIGYQLLFSGPITAILMFLAINYPSIKVFVASWGIGLWLIDILLLSKYQKELKEKAAIIQEKFDCDVLALPWNPLKANNSIDHELIKEYSNKYNNSKLPMPTIRDWYPTSVQHLPLALGRLVCQRANCWWDSNQRRRYAKLLAITLLILVLGVFTAGLLANLTLESFVLIIGIPLMPAITLITRQFNEHHEAADRLDKLKAYTDKLWQDAMAGLDEDILLTRSRTLQDEIFDGRKRNAPIFDWIFRRLRKDYESQMNHGSEDLVNEARDKLGI